jgi:hypothetical protein
MAILKLAGPAVLLYCIIKVESATGAAKHTRIPPRNDYWVRIKSLAYKVVLHLKKANSLCKGLRIEQILTHSKLLIEHFPSQSPEMKTSYSYWLRFTTPSLAQLGYQASFNGLSLPIFGSTPSPPQSNVNIFDYRLHYLNPSVSDNTSNNDYIFSILVRCATSQH